MVHSVPLEEAVRRAATFTRKCVERSERTSDSGKRGALYRGMPALSVPVKPQRLKGLQEKAEMGFS